MPTDASLLFLNELLEGNRPTEARIHELLDHRVEEDLHLDYKTGAWVDPASRKKKGKAEDKPPARLRKYVAGFANGEGGVIVIGVGEPPQDYVKRPIEPITIWNSAEEGERWLSDCASTLRPFLSPPPRVYVIDAAAGGHLAVVAVPRSHALVACEVKRRLVHFFRLHDKTLEVPSYLVEDLVLGRRQRPVLVPEMEATSRVLRDIVAVHPTFELGLGVRVSNRGLLWARSTIVGVVGPGIREVRTLERTGFRDNPVGGPPVMDELLQYVDLTDSVGWEPVVRFVSLDEAVLPPFARSRLTGGLGQVVQSTTSSFRWWAGVFILTEDHPPDWFQLVVDVHAGDQVPNEWERRGPRTTAVRSLLPAPRPVLAIEPPAD